TNSCRSVSRELVTTMNLDDSSPPQAIAGTARESTTQVFNPFIIAPLLKVCNRTSVHIAIVHVFTGHAPDEGIITGTGTRVYRPWGRNHRLFVLHPDMACFLGLAHEMAHRLPVGHLKVKIN